MPPAARAAGLDVSGTLDDLLEAADIVVDCTPKHLASKNIETYRRLGIKYIVHGGEKHESTGHSFVAEANYASAVGRDCSRRIVQHNVDHSYPVSAQTPRLAGPGTGTLLRRATDPWESHQGGIMNTVVPEPEIPSHQGPDAQSVDPDLDVVTMAVKVPETLAHLHYWSVQLTREASKDEVLDAFRTSSRIVFLRNSDGLSAINSVKELMADLGRPHDSLYECAWGRHAQSAGQ